MASSRSSPSSRSGYSNRDSSLPKRKTPCAFFPAGKCKNGDQCRFPHIMPSQSDTSVSPASRAGHNEASFGVIGDRGYIHGEFQPTSAVVVASSGTNADAPGRQWNIASGGFPSYPSWAYPSSPFHSMSNPMSDSQSFAYTIAKPPFVILEPEGLYPDTQLEESILSTSLSRSHFEVHQAHLDEDTPYSTIPLELRKKVDGLFVFRHWVREEDVTLFENLKVIVRMGVGYDRLDRVALKKSGVLVCNCPDYGTAEVADHAIALALSLRRGILLHHDAQRTLTSPKPASWEHITSPLIQRPNGRAFGILGLGRIGTAVALRAKALGWGTVLFFDPYLPNGVDRALGIGRVRTIEELFERSDTLSLHCPLTQETRGIVGKELLGKMKDGSVLVNTSRGGVVVLDALEEALKAGGLAGAALDAIPVEPTPGRDNAGDDDEVHPLIKAYRRGEEWLKGRLVITPHVGFYSPESWEDIRRLSCETMRDVLLDGLKTNVISIEDE